MSQIQVHSSLLGGYLTSPSGEISRIMAVWLEESSEYRPTLVALILDIKTNRLSTRYASNMDTTFSYNHPDPKSVPDTGGPVPITRAG